LDELALEARELSCGYPGRPVLEQIDLGVRSGSVTALLGPNGSGKSTLLKTLMGSIPATAGKASLLGRSLSEYSHRELAQTVAFVPQIEQTRFGFSVEEVVAMGRMPYAVGLFESPDDWAHVERAMAEADCIEFRHRPMLELSGGERQRALIARALAQDTPLIFMDEPTAHLDVPHFLALGKLVRRLAAAGRTVVMALHDLNLASTFADEAILLHGRHIALSGRVEEVLDSKKIDAVYGVDFQRMRDQSGMLRLFPNYEPDSSLYH
jgi:iron complex transport system ATP-binding protein